MTVCADTLKEICPLGMFQRFGEFHLADEQQSEKISFIILHIGQKPQIVKIGRRQNVGFIDDNDDFPALICRFKQKTVEYFKQIDLVFDFALLSGNLTDDFPQ